MPDFANVTFVWWWAFFLLPLPFIIRFFSRSTGDSAGDALKVPFFDQIANADTQFTKPRTAGWKWLLLTLAWFFLVCAVARPTLVGQPIAIPAEGRDLMLAIDLSHSMAERDLQGRRLNRLDVVKASADEFISRREGDRLGLIFFSDRAYLQAPLTFDKRVVRELLTEAQVGLTGRATAIGDAIATALKRLQSETQKPVAKQTEQQAKNQQKTDNNDSKVLILLTDGANSAGVMKPLQASDIAKKLGIKIYTIGVGSDRRDIFGRQVAEIDESTLKKIAKATGGQYFRATDAQMLDNIYREIDKLEPVNSDPQHIRPQVALYFYPAGLAFVLLAMFLAFSLGKTYKS